MLSGLKLLFVPGFSWGQVLLPVCVQRAGWARPKCPKTAKPTQKCSVEMVLGAVSPEGLLGFQELLRHLGMAAQQKEGEAPIPALGNYFIFCHWVSDYSRPKCASEPS